MARPRPSIYLGRGSVCIFDMKEGDECWLPERLTRQTKQTVYRVAVNPESPPSVSYTDSKEESAPKPAEPDNGSNRLHSCTALRHPPYIMPEGYTGLDTEHSLLKLIDNTVKVLNHSKPELTESCCLWYNAKLPFFEGIAIPGNYTTTSSYTACCWTPAPDRVTLQAVQN